MGAQRQIVILRFQTLVQNFHIILADERVVTKIQQYFTCLVNLRRRQIKFMPNLTSQSPVFIHYVEEKAKKRKIS